MTNLSKTIMPFGQYEDQPFENIPEDYLRHILTLPYLRQPLRKQIEDYLSISPLTRAINKVKEESMDDNQEEYEQ